MTLSFAAENEARMRAMIAARDNVEETLSGLVALSRQLRQEEITNEIVELASGAAARAKRGGANSLSAHGGKRVGVSGMGIGGGGGGWSPDR